MHIQRYFKKIMLTPSFIASPSECKVINMQTSSFTCTGYILVLFNCVLNNNV